MWSLNKLALSALLLLPHCACASLLEWLALPVSSNSRRRSLQAFATGTTAKSFAAVCAKSASPPAANDSLILEVAAQTRYRLEETLANMTTHEQARLFGTAFQLVLHDAAETDINSEDHLSGSDGCLSVSVRNAELLSESSLVLTLVEPMWQQHCDRISRADFWVLFAKMALERADPTGQLRLSFQYGRRDAADCSNGGSRLLDNQRDESELIRVFVQQLGLSIHEAVTLMGGRSVGLHHNGLYAWDDTPAVLDNHYFERLARTVWKSEYDAADRSKNLWLPAIAEVVVPVSPPLANISFSNDSMSWNNSNWLVGDIFVDLEEPLPVVLPQQQQKEAMLNLDIALVHSIDTLFSLFYNSYYVRSNTICGPYLVANATENGCTQLNGEEIVGWTELSFDQVQLYASDNDVFLWFFGTAFERLTTVGYGIVNGIMQRGELGELTSVQVTSNSNY